MKRLKRMTLEARYFPPGPTYGFEELEEDLRRKVPTGEKKDVYGFVIKNIVGVAVILWSLFYLFNARNQGSGIPDSMGYFSVFGILISITYLVFGIPFLTIRRLQKIRSRCRICGGQLETEQFASGSISVIRYLCDSCKKFSTDSRYTVTMGFE